MNLGGHRGGLYDEAAHNLFYGLQDHHFARSMLRRVGKEERERFSELGWAYGDPSYVYGTDPMEVFLYQSNVVVKTLFGEGMSCDLVSFCSDEEELYEFLSDLRDEDGLAQRSPPEEVSEADLYGDAGVIACEVSGGAEDIWRLKRALRAAGLGGSFLHHAPESERGKNADRRGHFLLLYDAEPYPERETIHHEIFDLLVRAWEAMRGGPGGEELGTR